MTREDADCACTIGRRWKQYRLEFAGNVSEGDFERKLQRCLAIVQKRWVVARSTIARHAKLESRTLDSTRDTLEDREEIMVEARQTIGRPAESWHAVVRGEE